MNTVLSFFRRLTLNYPFLHPRERILRNLPDVPANYGTFIARKGIKYSSYPNGKDYIVKNLFWFGDFEPWVIYVISRLVKQGDIIFDIGANIGDSALQIMPYVGRSGQIFSFEPVPILQECLLKNLSENKISSVTLIPKALSNFSGKLIMTVLSAQPGGSKIIKDKSLSSDNENIEVEATTLDAWLIDKNITQIALCKVDVEGHELEVFEGMRDSFNEGRIGSIVFERYMNDMYNDPVVNFLKDQGFNTYRIHKSFFKVNVFKLNESFRQYRATSDYIAVLKGSIFEERLRNFTLSNS